MLFKIKVVDTNQGVTLDEFEIDVLDDEGTLGILAFLQQKAVSEGFEVLRHRRIARNNRRVKTYVKKLNEMSEAFEKMEKKEYYGKNVSDAEVDRAADKWSEAMDTGIELEAEPV